MVAEVQSDVTRGAASVPGDVNPERIGLAHALDSVEKVFDSGLCSRGEILERVVSLRLGFLECRWGASLLDLLNLVTDLHVVCFCRTCCDCLQFGLLIYLFMMIRVADTPLFQSYLVNMTSATLSIALSCLISKDIIWNLKEKEKYGLWVLQVGWRGWQRSCCR